MTKSEFENKFNELYNSKFKEFSAPEHLKNMLSSYADDDNKVSTESIAAFSFIESVKFNNEFLKTLLLDVLEFDE